jgi:hypothetical protein
MTLAPDEEVVQARCPPLEDVMSTLDRSETRLQLVIEEPVLERDCIDQDELVLDVVIELVERLGRLGTWRGSESVLADRFLETLCEAAEDNVH